MNLDEVNGKSNFPIRGRKSFAKKIFYFLAPFGIIIVIWYILAEMVLFFRGVPFPYPHDVAFQLYSMFRGEEYVGATLLSHVSKSVMRWFMGFGIAAAVGIAIGLLAGWSDIAESLISPIVYMLQPIPSLAWIPVAILLVGLGWKSVLLIVFLASFFPIAINVTAGVRGADEMHLRAAKMLGANDRSIFLRVLLPSSVPQILSGLRIGFANAWRAMVAAEMVLGTTTGLGFAIYQSKQVLNFQAGLAFLVIIALIGLSLERGIFRRIEKATSEKWGLKRK